MVACCWITGHTRVTARTNCRQKIPPRGRQLLNVYVCMYIYIVLFIYVHYMMRVAVQLASSFSLPFINHLGFDVRPHRWCIWKRLKASTAASWNICRTTSRWLNRLNVGFPWKFEAIHGIRTFGEWCHWAIGLAIHGIWWVMVIKLSYAAHGNT